jgi:Tfp pilus assembly protein FimT
MSAAGEARRAASEAGATLLEMLVVLGVLTLTAGLVYPNLKRPLATLAPEACRAALEADLRTARAEAIRQDRTTEIDFAADGRTYSVDGRSVRLSDSVRLAADVDRIRFDPDGSSSGGQLLIQSAKGPPLRLQVAAATGVVLAEGGA